MASGGYINNYYIHNISCDKNNHKGYDTPCPIKMSQIPERFRSSDLEQLLSSLCSLTVKITVKSRSKNRQEQRSQEITANMPRVYQEFQGSGRVCDIVNFSSQNCRSKCKTKLICVQTCNHLVFDNYEARHTECVLFFDGADVKSITLKNGTMLKYDIDKDTSMLAFELCENHIITRLENDLSRFTLLSKKLQKKYSYVKDEERLSVIVSHPHGCYKCVSFGTWDLEDDYFTYNAATCPASSGGSVFLLGASSNDLIHRGISPSGQNCSNSVDRPISCLLVGQRRSDL